MVGELQDRPFPRRQEWIVFSVTLLPSPVFLLGWLLVSSNKYVDNVSMNSVNEILSVVSIESIRAMKISRLILVLL